MGIIEDALPNLQKYYEIVKRKNTSPSPSYKAWGSPEKYVKALYWMKFVKKYDYIEIAEILGKNHMSVRNNYASLGWYNSCATLEKCEEENRAIRDKIESALESMDRDPSLLNNQYYLESPFYANTSLLNQRVQSTFGVMTTGELFKRLFYMLRIKNFPSSDISLYYNLSPGTLRKHLIKYQIGLSSKEARERTEALGKGNHGRARASFNKNMLKHSLENGVSNRYELLFRDLLSSTIISYLPENEYESIIGVQTISVIPPYEIDIPIIVIHKISKSIHKFAIELNGDIWHNEEKAVETDSKKEIMTFDNHWKLITIVFDRTSLSDGKLKTSFIRLVRHVSQLIADCISSSKLFNQEDLSHITIDGFSPGSSLKA